MSIQLKISTEAGKVPVAADLIQGELAMNTVDGKLYAKNSVETVFRLLTTLDRRSDVRADGYTDDSVVTETGIRAAINEAVSGVSSYWVASGTNIYNINMGFVGIATNTPECSLHVTGTAKATKLALGNASATSTYYIDIVTPGGGTDFFRMSGNGVAVANGFFRITNSTVSSNVFEPIFWAKSNSTYTGLWFLADGQTDSGPNALMKFEARQNNTTVVNRPLFLWYNRATEVMRMLANGNLGIGTTPTSRLHVGGTITANTAIFNSVRDNEAVNLIGLDSSNNLTTRVMPFVLSNIRYHVAGLGLSGNAYNGSSDTTWSVAFAGNGDSNFAARSNHNHDDQYAAFGHNHYLVSLADVLIDTLADGDVLAYSLADDQWLNVPVGIQYWKKIGAELSPLTDGDTISVGSDITSAIYAYASTDYGIRTEGWSGGIWGNSTIGAGTYGSSVSGPGNWGFSSSGPGSRGFSTNGPGGEFTSVNNFAITGTVNSNSTNAVFLALNLSRSTTGTALNGIGTGISFLIEQASGVSATSATFAAMLTNVATGAESSAFAWSIRNAGSPVTEYMRLTGAGLSVESDVIFTKANGSAAHLRGYHLTGSTPGFLKSGDYAGSLSFDAWSGATTFANVAGIKVNAVSDHSGTSFGSEMDFLVTTINSTVPITAMTLLENGLTVGNYGFATQAGPGLNMILYVITALGYDGPNRDLIMSRSALTYSGGIIVDYEELPNIIINLP